MSTSWKWTVHPLTVVWGLIVFLIAYSIDGWSGIGVAALASIRVTFK